MYRHVNTTSIYKHLKLMLVLLKTIRKSLIKQFIAIIQTIIVFVEEFEDTKEVIRIRKSDNTMGKRKSTKGQTTIYKTYI